jgi:hypothetical protein
MTPAIATDRLNMVGSCARIGQASGKRVPVHLNPPFALDHMALRPNVVGAPTWHNKSHVKICASEQDNRWPSYDLG